MNVTKSLARRLLGTALTAAIATGLGAAALDTAPAHAWSGCEGDCVNAVKVTQTLATKASPKLTFTTTVPTKVVITFKQVGGGIAGAVGSSSTTFSSSHSLNAGPILTQGKGYVASIKATDANGKSFTDQVSITALARTVKLTLKGIKITEDSDVGAGELRAGIRVGGTVATVFGTRSISAVKELSPNKIVTATGVAAGSKIALEIQDDDADLGEFCTNGTSFGFTSGSNKCLDWTTGSTAMSLGSTKGTFTEQFWLGGNGRLKFSAWGSYTVTIA